MPAFTKLGLKITRAGTLAPAGGPLNHAPRRQTPRLKKGVGSGLGQLCRRRKKTAGRRAGGRKPIAGRRPRQPGQTLFARQILPG